MELKELEIKNKLQKNILLPITIGGYEISTPGIKNDFTTIPGIAGKVVEVLNFAVGLSVVVAVAMIIYSGYMFITSAGDPEKVAKGTNALTAAIVGMIIVFLARVLVVFLITDIIQF